MKHLVWLGIIFGLLLVTTPFKGWNEGIDYLQANDVRSSYEKVSRAAPHFPAENLARHHAQRVFWPFLLGSISHYSGFKIENIYRLALVALYFLLVAGFIFALRAIGVEEGGWRWFFLLLFCNPYFFRYYWIVPGMLADVAFMCFSVWVALFAIQKRVFALLSCFCLMLLSRQTAIFLLPALLFLFWANRRDKGEFLLNSGLVISVFAGLYILINATVASFSEADKNMAIFLSLWSYFRGAHASGGDFFELVLRVFLPLGFVLCLFLGSVRNAKLSWLVVFFALGVAGIISQPILGGPIITGKNAGRLAALALPWMVLGFAALFPHFPLRAWPKWALGALLFLSSFHHWYSQPTLPSIEAFVLMQLACMAVAGLLIYFSAMRERREPLALR